jgi:DNA polymerase-3 subunit alpha
VAVTYEHPALEPILKETYGIFVYQEQVMQAANVLAGYSLGKADLLRRAMGKKKPEEMEKQRAVFVKGCDEHQKIPKTHAEKIFDILAKFAGYGFNKSHSAAYAVVAYQTAWLKANYPVEFMAALLSNELANTDKIQLFINECRTMGIEVLSPDVNESEIRFSVVPATDPATARHAKAIRFGLAAIKNVGEIAVENIIAARAKDGRFKSFDDFCERIDLRTVNRKVLENLCKCGALDSLIPSNGKRSGIFSEIDWQMNRASAIQRDRQRGQSALFEIEPVNVRRQMPHAESAVAWTESEMLAFEKELLGFYVSGHPLAKYADILRRYDLTPTSKLGELKDGDAARLGGIISKLQLKTTKQGKPMAIINLEDLDGTVEALAFSEAYTKYTANIQPDAAVYICGTVNRREEPPKIYADQVLKLDDVPRRFTKAVHIRIPVANANDSQLEQIRDILRQHKGACPVIICFIYPDGRLVFMETDDFFAVTPSADLIAKIESLIGEETVYLKVDTEKLLAPPVSPKQRFANYDGRKSN